MMLARSGFSFKKKLEIKLLLLSMMSSQCFLPPKVGVEGELMLKKSLLPNIFYQGTAFLLTACCLALPKAQSSYSLKVPATSYTEGFNNSIGKLTWHEQLTWMDD